MTAAVATWVICPEEVSETSQRRISTSSGAESGHSRARQTVERELRSWRLRWTTFPAQALVEYSRIFGLAAGCVLPILWTPPGGSELAVRFLSGTKRVVRDSAVAISFEFEFEEVR